MPVPFMDQMEGRRENKVKIHLILANISWIVKPQAGGCASFLLSFTGGQG